MIERHMIEAWIPGKPVPWQRTRNGRRTDERYGAWKDLAAGVMLQARMPDGKLEGPVAARATVKPGGIAVVFYNVDYLERPRGLRGDLDNYVKGVLDAANGVMYGDDAQVSLIAAEFQS